ncbi:MAG TPA: metallophosphoesterase [Symbiobacteriaceae bacterium]|nr:metallophosphoesterase [Symbiobacteriaceae bacterium]
MLSRRNLIKALGVLFLTAAGGASLWEAWQQIRSLQPDVLPVTPVLPDRELLFSFFLLSDIHMSTTVSAMEEKLKLALADISRFSIPVQSVVLGGDLVDGGREDEYQLLGRIFAEYKLPTLYGNMGNHEYYDIWYDERGGWSKETVPNGKTDATARERFMRFMGHEDRPYYDVWVNGVHLIMLSQEAYIQEKPDVGEGAWYSDAQLAWLEKQMRSHADGKPVFIFIHQPLPPIGQDGGSHRLIPAREFRRILAPYRNVFVLSGHTHRNFEADEHYVRDATFHWFTNASVGKTRAVGPVQTPVQGLYVQVYRDQVVLLGREFSSRTWIKRAEWAIQLV